MSRNTVSINWEFILDKLREEQCLLVLGPEAYRTENEATLQEELIRELALPSNENIQKYYEEDGFFLFDDPYKRTLACHQIKAFYRTAQPDKTLLQLARLPFHVMLTVTPDKVLPAAFEQLNFNFQFGSVFSVSPFLKNLKSSVSKRRYGSFFSLLAISSI